MPYTAASVHGGSQIQWGGCDPSVVNDTSLSCGFLEVPLDYQDPLVGRARLAIIKANATGERRGSVFFNPGGPGNTGIEGVNDNKAELLEVTGGVYDIVSWDPRGVGNRTSPGEVFCFDSLAEYSTFFNGTIELTGIEETGNFTDPADVQALLEQAPNMQKKYEEVGQKCLRSSSGKFLKYIGTAVAVRDMVSIANVLDGPEAPINYLGRSYGTLIGSWFVNMFPERVGRVTLDGVFDPIAFATQETGSTFSSQRVSADTIYKALLTGCALTGPSGCAATSEGDGPLDIDTKVQALLKSAYDATKDNSSVPMTPGDIRLALWGEMYFPVDWSNFVNEEYLQIVQIVNREAPANKSRAFRKRSNHLNPLHRRKALVKRSSESNDSPSYTTSAIYCADSVDPQGTTMEDAFKGITSATRNVSHMFGSLWPFPVYCSFWPVRSVERYQGPFNKKLANKILIASNLLDPITPLPAAETLAGLLGRDAVLVRQNGFGHTTVSAPSGCMNEIFIAYMTNGTLPANGTVCEVDADYEIFAGINTADILANIPSTDI
ncbi:alpha/beta-hydrolase [Lentinus brumalis]|uniref:Alpha/beta-hydrolase n=1 Tax=Lentinus brumalis TaxID=2498619 RepID=A0A371D9A1_9APHY|nr:alpha/beta-hydrolase [Polyporus brumalis]